MSRLGLSEAIWAAWLIIFLALELPAALHAVPWNTLSRTSWMDEETYPVLRTLLLGFLIGLGVHIRFSADLGRCTVGGMLVALAVNYLFIASV